MTITTLTTSSSHLSDLTFLGRLGAAMGCGLLIGIERQYRSRMAGLRSNTLVATGAALFVLYSDVVGDAGSPTRVASYVVSGVCFLGGGVILRDGFNIQGLNTAATLWCSAAASLLATTGRYTLAFTATAAIILVHLLGRPLGRAIDRAPSAAEEAITAYTLQLTVRRKNEPHVRAQLLATLTDPTIALQSLSTQAPSSALATSATQDDHPAASTAVTLTADLLIEGTARTLLDPIVTRLSLEPGVRTVNWTLRQPDTRQYDETRLASN